MELAHAVQHHAHVRINLRHNKASSSTTTASAVGTLWMRALVVLVWCLRLPFDWEQAQVLHAVVKAARVHVATGQTSSVGLKRHRVVRERQVARRGSTCSSLLNAVPLVASALRARSASALGTST